VTVLRDPGTIDLSPAAVGKPASLRSAAFPTALSITLSLSDEANIQGTKTPRKKERGHSAAVQSVRGLGTRRNAIDLTFTIVYHKLITCYMDLSADGSGLIPSDLDVEHGLVGWLIVDSHCNVTLPASSSSSRMTKEFMRSSRPTASIENGLDRERPASRGARARRSGRWTAAAAAPASA